MHSMTCVAGGPNMTAKSKFSSAMVTSLASPCGAGVCVGRCVRLLCQLHHIENLRRQRGDHARQDGRDDVCSAAEELTDTCGSCCPRESMDVLGWLGRFPVAAAVLTSVNPLSHSVNHISHWSAGDGYASTCHGIVLL